MSPPALRVLFVVSDIFLSEPLGSMQLSAICRQHGHTTRFAALTRRDFGRRVAEFRPDVVAYSAMTPDAQLFAAADREVRRWAAESGATPVRIMGGPHATFFPEVLDELALDAVCVGEGDRAIVTLLARAAAGEDFRGIPNVLSPQDREPRRELILDLDALPFVDRASYYEAFPHCREAGLRSVYSSRGCPYQCTYCHNHAFNEMFRGVGPVVRRRSPEHVVREIADVVRRYSPVSFVRFGDDTLAHAIDPWLEELLARYRQQIALPFYCLMRSNTLTAPMARLLRAAGCRSVSMSVETGSERVRQEILKRNLSDEVVRESFRNAQACGLRTYGNTMLGLPGTTPADDFASFRFTRSLRMTMPLFGVFCPYPRTELARYAIAHGWLAGDVDLSRKPTNLSALSCYTDREKRAQRRLSHLAPVFCFLPGSLDWLLRALMRLPLDRLYAVLSALFVGYRTSRLVFPGIRPRTLSGLARIAADTVRILSQPR